MDSPTFRNPAILAPATRSPGAPYRAAALLARLMGVRALYARVISQGAMEELNRAGIEAGCETMVEAVRNRAGTGLCPMEQLSRGVEDPEEMLAKAEEFLAGLAEQA